MHTAPQSIAWRFIHCRCVEPPGAAFAASRSIFSSFSNVIDLIDMILGLQSTSVRLPFSENRRPVRGRTTSGRSVSPAAVV